MPLTAKELETSEIIGSVDTEFETTINWKKSKTLLDRAYYELLKKARQQYDGKTDVKNIILERHTSKHAAVKNSLFLIPAIFYATSVGFSYTNIYAKGEVIRHNEENSRIAGSF